MNEIPQMFRLQFFLRSGASFVIDAVTEFEEKRDPFGNRIGFAFSQFADRTRTRLMDEMFDMGEVVAVLRLPDEEGAL